MLFTYEEFLVYKLETFQNCKELKHTMIMIIALIYILFYLMWYLINSWKQLKIISRKSSVPPPEKIHSPFFTHSLLKIQKLQVTHFLPTLKIFRPPAENGGGAGQVDYYLQSF